jgi:hypothetical protein
MQASQAMIRLRPIAKPVKSAKRLRRAGIGLCEASKAQVMKGGREVTIAGVITERWSACRAI